MATSVSPDEVVWMLGKGRRVTEFFQGSDYDRIMRSVGHDWIVTTRQKDDRHFIVFQPPNVEER